ncbi:bifunctional folylpolyglutamate synthase/dihydrofolate synthase [Polycladidibacter hongkongensis]|uniref:bifunctional folylpolyglutamate synthase/dihydrofolate synthase n=1 Tax=Polycladidibacter hongkongensis TaxID=1647556 RepID=UPI000834A17A|nr:folylpolyglutamate synthase/dihydrofolate synthase family protein [Pseudovibrio hongkongensis]
MQSTLQGLLDQFMALHPSEIDLSLERMQRLLRDLGEPQRKLPPVIHVAGTNGKGSTSAFLRSALRALGKSAHVYSSPHLCRFNERIRLGQPDGFVGDGALIDALTHVLAVNAGQEITFFEATTATALWLFAQNPADYLILEVGLGGLYDATNVIDAPLVSVITPISRDHENFLGSDLAGIAAEKAGIIKAGCPVVSAQQTEEVEKVLHRQAAKLKAPFTVFGQDFAAMRQDGRFVFEDQNALLDLKLPRMSGQHQIENAGLAIAALRAGGLLQNTDHFTEVDHALTTTRWPARLQRLGEGALVDDLPLRSEIWVDGGHNPDAARAISTFLAELNDSEERETYLICGMMNSKDLEGYFRNFVGLASEVLCVPLTTTPHGVEPEELAKTVTTTGLCASHYADFESALSTLRGRSLDGAQPPRILITGSLYLAGEVLERNGTPPT